MTTRSASQHFQNISTPLLPNQKEDMKEPKIYETNNQHNINKLPRLIFNLMKIKQAFLL